MKRRHTIPEETRRLQTEASDPGNSAWVSAHAGSGKTHVLVLRVIRLLLAGTDPSKILCLTYTRAAASVMANRVFRDLSAWTMLDDSALSERIAEIEGTRPSPGKLARARKLFAEALETPGGLKIQTIHAFCEAILHKFPLEANIAGHFDMLDSEMEAALFGEARRDMIAGTMVAENHALAEAFAAILARGGEYWLETLLTEVVQRRDELRTFIEATDERTLFDEFGFAEDETAASIAAAVWPLPGFSPAEFAELQREAERQGAAQTLDKFILPAAAAFRERDPERRLLLLRDAFLKEGRNPEPYSATWLFKASLRKVMPSLADDYLAAAEIIIATADRYALFRMLEATKAMRVVADALIGRYERLKSGRGLLDFNDLITRTGNLLRRPDAGPWIQYKLDQGIDHILIDEAQDTSPQQWQVVVSLAQEFFAGLSTRDGKMRTVFAVGDEKQSIYSFQGADPAAFAETRFALRKRVEAAQGRFHDVRLQWSFRSTDDVLHAVDRVFADPGVRNGLTRDPETIEHKAIRAGAPGSVEVWPTVGAEQVTEPDDWATPVDEASAPAVRVAERVADAIAGMTRAGSSESIKPGEILVLVRKRDRFVQALSRSLKDRGVPVAGADRLSLSDHIAVQDMMALGRFCLLPEDDLSLAAVLRSPVFGLSEEQLFSLSFERLPARSLIASLRAAASSDLLLHGVVEQLDRWAVAAAFRPPFEFFAGVLGADGVRRKMIARLGEDAGDILDEFMSFCLAQEKVGLPGLEAFLATLATAAPEIKREMDQTRDEVRIMTVHAAKGMEARLVFLVDSGSAPFADAHLPRLIPLELKGKAVKAFLWRAGADLANAASKAICNALKIKGEEEYRRLLYVGMTRAEDHLVVCGYHGKRTPMPGTWHSIVKAALRDTPYSEIRTDPETGEETIFYRVTRQPQPDRGPAETARPAPRAAVPPTLQRNPPPAERLPRPLAPSGASVLIEEGKEIVISGRSPVLDPDLGPAFAAARGTAMHRLLQVLPSLPQAARPAAALRYLDRAGRDWAAAERQAVLDSVARLLADAGFAPVFAEGSRAEVELMGTLRLKGVERAVSGKIDRLAVTPERVLIVDFKTNRPPPGVLGDVPEAYVFQLALYRALLQKIYPDRPVEAALIFTEAPLLMPLPAEVMDAALARLTRA